MGKIRNKKRLDRVKAEVPIISVLADFGYQVRADGGDREQQFSCDLHGDGLDSKPSARVYPRSNSWYCFACNVTRDTVQTIRDKEDLGFIDAVAYLEQKYRLPPLPWEPDDEPGAEPSDEPLTIVPRQKKTFDDDCRRFQALLESTTQDRTLPMRSTLIYWEGLDKLRYLIAEGMVKEGPGRQALEKMRVRLVDSVVEEHALG